MKQSLLALVFLSLLTLSAALPPQQPVIGVYTQDA